MKLSQNKKIHICPIKKLPTELDKNLPDRKTVAIMLSTEDLTYHDFGLPDAYYKANVLDTEIEGKRFSFNYEDGLKVKKFLDLHSDFERLYVCCDSGESRSTAMAAAIMRYYGKSDKEIWTNPYYHPNTLVYKEQMRAFGFKVGKIKLCYLKHLSNKALEKLINKN